MATLIKNNVGVIVSILMWVITGATSLGAAKTILANLKESQTEMKDQMNKEFTEVKVSIEKYKDKCDDKFTSHDQRITRCETRLEQKK